MNRGDSASPIPRMHRAPILGFEERILITAPLYEARGSAILFFPSQELGATIRAGTIVGIVRSLEGRIIEEVSSPQEGVLILIRATPRIYPGENVAALASEG